MWIMLVLDNLVILQKVTAVFWLLGQGGEARFLMQQAPLPRTDRDLREGRQFINNSFFTIPAEKLSVPDERMNVTI